MAETYSFSDFPEDVQLSVLSFLSPPEITSFACTSKRFLHLCRDESSKLWYSLCDRRWGPLTKILLWGQSRISYKLLYRTLHKWDNLIGFWRLCGSHSQTSSSAPSLIFFEWGPSFILCSRVSRSEDPTYMVVKSPFLWMGISPEGQIASYLDPDGRSDANWVNLSFSDADSDLDLVPVNVDFIGNVHLRVEEDVGFNYGKSSSSGNLSDNNVEEAGCFGFESGSPEETLEIYRYYANRMSPGAADRVMRRQRKKEKDRQGRRRSRLCRWQTEHFLKINDSAPTPARPLQGLWKGICDDMKLEFYLVTYDGAGLSCRRVGNLSEHLSSSTPVFWTSNPAFVDAPLSPDEAHIYDSRIHIRPSAVAGNVLGLCPEIDTEVVTQIMHINSSYDLVIPGLVETAANPWCVEGRIWKYKNGTFGFGFLRDSFIVDLKHIAHNGCLLDAMGPCGD